MQHSKSFSFSSCASPQGTALFRIQTVVLVHSIIKNIPPSLKIQEVLVCPKLTSLNLTTFIEVKMHQHLQHQLSVMDLDRDGPGPKERGLATAAAALQGQG